MVRGATKRDKTLLTEGESYLVSCCEDLSTFVVDSLRSDCMEA